MPNNRPYTKTEIKAWQDNLTRIPQTITQLKANLREDKSLLNSTTANRDAVRAILKPLDENIHALSAKIQILDNLVEMAGLQKTIDVLTPKVEAALRQLNDDNERWDAAKAAVSRAHELVKIKNAQSVVNTIPGEMTDLQSRIAQFSSAMLAEQNTASMLNMRISSLQNTISRLETAERLDREKHQREAMMAREREYHHHHHHHGHGHDHDHDHDHQPSLLLMGLSALATVGEYVTDASRATELANARRDYAQAQGQQSHHQSTANTYHNQISQANQKYAALQSTLFSNQSILSIASADLRTAAETTTLSALQTDVNKKEDDERQGNNIVNAARNTYEHFHNTRERASRSHARLDSNNEDLAKRTGRHAANTDRNDLATQLAAVQAEKAPHASNEQALDNACATIASRISDTSTDIENLNSKYQRLSGNTFLTTLRDNPVALQNELVASYEAAIKAFDVKQPAGKSQLEQITLHEMKADVPAIVNGSGEPHPQLEGQPSEFKSDDDGLPWHPTRLKVYQLCGMLHRKIGTLIDAEAKSELLVELRKVTGKFPLNAVEVCADYQQLQRPSATAQDMMSMEVKAFDETARTLRASATQILNDATLNNIKEWRAFANSVIDYADSIEANRTHEQFDVAFYASLLQAANTLLLNPNGTTDGKPNLDVFNDLLEHDTLGKANNCKRGTGIVSMLLGGGLVITTAIADKFGYIDNFAHEYAAKAKYTSYGVGGAGFLGGLYLLFKGQPKGSVKQGTDLADKSRKVRFFEQPRRPAAEPAIQSLQTPLLSIHVDSSSGDTSAPSAPTPPPAYSL